MALQTFEGERQREQPQRWRWWRQRRQDSPIIGDTWKRRQRLALASLLAIANLWSTLSIAMPIRLASCLETYQQQQQQQQHQRQQHRQGYLTNGLPAHSSVGALDTAAAVVAHQAAAASRVVDAPPPSPHMCCHKPQLASGSRSRRSRTISRLKRGAGGSSSSFKRSKLTKQSNQWAPPQFYPNDKFPKSLCEKIQYSIEQQQPRERRHSGRIENSTSRTNQLVVVERPEGGGEKVVAAAATEAAASYREFTRSDEQREMQLIELLAQFYAHLRQVQVQLELHVARQFFYNGAENWTTQINQTKDQLHEGGEGKGAVENSNKFPIGEGSNNLKKDKKQQHQEFERQVARLKMQLGADDASLQHWLQQHKKRFDKLENVTFELLQEHPNRTVNVCLDGPKILVLPNVSDIIYCYTPDQWMEKLWHDLRLSAFHYPMIALNILIFLFGTTGNIFVCLSVKRNLQLRSVTNYFIVNLAFADFLVILICLPATVIWDLSLTWFFDTIPCKLIMFLQDVSISVSVLTLTAISIDRYYAICHPLKFKTSLNQAKRAIALIWLVSLLIMIPDLVYLSAKRSADLSEAGLDTVLYSDCNYDWSESSSRAFQFVKTILLYFLPFLLMFCAHYRIQQVLRLASVMAHNELQMRMADGPTTQGTPPAIAMTDVDISFKPTSATTATTAPPVSRNNNSNRESNGAIPLLLLQPSNNQKAAISDSDTPLSSGSQPPSASACQLAAQVCVAPAGSDNCDKKFSNDGSQPTWARPQMVPGSCETVIANSAEEEGKAPLTAPSEVEGGVSKARLPATDVTPAESTSGAHYEYHNGDEARNKHDKRRLHFAMLLARDSLESFVGPVVSATTRESFHQNEVGGNCEGICGDGQEIASLTNGEQLAATATAAVSLPSSLHASPVRPITAVSSVSHNGSGRCGGASHTNLANGLSDQRATTELGPEPQRLAINTNGRERESAAITKEGLAACSSDALILTMHNTNKLESRRKAAKMLTAIVVLFGLCYLPVHLINFLRQFIDDIPQTDITSTLSMLAHCVCYLNSAINPIIYNHMNSVFRAEFRKFLSCLDWRRQPPGRRKQSSPRNQADSNNKLNHRSPYDQQHKQQADQKINLFNERAYNRHYYQNHHHQPQQRQNNHQNQHNGSEQTRRPAPSLMLTTILTLEPTTTD